MSILIILSLLPATIAVFVWLKRNTTSRKTEEASDPKVNFNVRVRRPKKSGSAEEIRADEDRYLADMRLRSTQAFLRDRKNAVGIGSKKYIWRTCGDGDVCRACERNEGERFLWEQSPAIGHPGECQVCEIGFCRCYAEAVLPRY